MRIPLQLFSISRKRELDLVSPSRAPHSIKRPFFYEKKYNFASFHDMKKFRSIKHPETFILYIIDLLHFFITAFSIIYLSGYGEK